MKNNLEFTIFTPQKQIKIGEVKEVIVETIEGSLAILPKHISMIAYLKPTVTQFVNLNGEKKNIFTSTGTLKVKENNVYIICDSAEYPENIDLKRAKEAKERAEKRLRESKDKIDVKRAEMALFRAVSRIKAKQI
ncbi:F0F1 ATP synthase subunit epsilon [Clostridium oceanicum]|uniref:ATP synthase epsilon chain n=1 Tax=Clostridium oceanicum TaxID=1543 RepID=A0ABN1JQM2_9CLOT